MLLTALFKSAFHSSFSGQRRTGNMAKKLLRIMKLTAIILLAACLQVSARSGAQTVTLSEKNAPLQKVFKEIKRQTGYNFLYTLEQLAEAGPVTVEVRNVSLQEALDRCLQNKVLSYTIVDKTVVVKRKVPVVVNVEKNPLPTEVKGKVINEKGEPVVGATVKIKGTEIGTSTNENGEFTLDVPMPDMILVITAVNIETLEVPINARTNIVINAKTSVKAIEAVTVNKGYYTTSQLFNTGSVSKVTAEEISKQPVANPIATLQGRVPGLLITQQGGLPGAGFKVLIRGQNSIQNGNSPLYVIDGVPFLNDADELTQRSGIRANSPFNTIDPLDIESIEILKDADATAIYGSRGANGVILITTKKGKPGKTTLDISYYKGWGKVTRTMDFMNTQQYLEMRHEALSNDGQIADQSNAYDFLVWDSTRYTDLKKLLIGGTANTDNFNLRFSGGTANTKFSFGNNLFQEGTVFPGNNKAKRISFDLAINHISTDKRFSINTTVGYSIVENNLIPADLTQFIKLPPTIPALYDSAGNLTWNKGGFGFDNPLSYTRRKYNVITDRFTVNTVLEYKILRSLVFRTSLGYNIVGADEKSLIPISSQDLSLSPTGSAFFGTNKASNWIIEPQFDFNKGIAKKGKLQATLGATINENSNKLTSISGSGYTNDNVLNSTIGAQTIVAKNGYSLYRYDAIFGRINYNWDEKYLVNITGRRDGSSRFGPGKQFANFEAIGLGWIFSNEPFIKNKLSFLNYGKLRGSYGTSGNDLIGNYQYLDTYSGTQYPYQGQPALFPTRLFNSDYSWERIKKLNLALELGAFNNRVNITAEWFKSKSDNQIIYYSLPGQTGFTNVLKNFPGVVQNTGIEFSFNTVNLRQKNFTWETEFNITIPKNKLLEFPGLESSSYSTTYIIGKPLNSVIGALFLGVDPQTGVYQFLDINKNPTFVPGSSDYVYAGTTDPKYYGGLQNSFSYKKWQLSFLVEFKKQMGNHPIYNFLDLVGSANNEPVAVLNRWQKPGDNKPYGMFTQTYGPAGTAIYYLFNSSAVLTDASFARLKNMSLSYSFPANWLRKSKIEKLRLYMEAQNLFVITKYKGADPEMQNLRNLPPLKIFATGIQLTF